ncbi:unnamed protein product, partial [marine sediment metagenome]
EPYLKQWMITAGVGEIVHIKRVYDARNSAAEVLKYVTKAAADLSGTFDRMRLITKSRNYDPHDIYAVSNDNTPGYTWAHLLIAADVVLEYLIQNRGWTFAPRGSMQRMEILPPPEEHPLADLVKVIRSDLGLPRLV